MANGEVFTDADLDQIKEGLARLDDADELIAQAQRAGIDTEEFSKSSRNGRDQLLKLKQAFFPGK